MKNLYEAFVISFLSAMLMMIVMNIYDNLFQQVKTKQQPHLGWSELHSAAIFQVPVENSAILTDTTHTKGSA